MKRAFTHLIREGPLAAGSRDGANLDKCRSQFQGVDGGEGAVATASQQKKLFTPFASPAPSLLTILDDIALPLSLSRQSTPVKSQHPHEHP